MQIPHMVSWLVRSATASIGLWTAIALAPLVQAQGIASYVNFETPQLRPMAVTQIQGDSYILVCNSPDNRVEVYSAIDFAFVKRIPVGQEPVSILVKHTPLFGETRRCYVANWLGDSISLFDLKPAGHNVLEVDTLRAGSSRAPGMAKRARAQ